VFFLFLPARTLGKDVAPQRLDVDATTNDSPNGGEARVVPAGNAVVLYEPRELEKEEKREKGFKIESVR
jgi:hypothetical protein